MKQIILLLTIFCSGSSLAQRISFSTGVGGIRNFSPAQMFWSFGQSINADFHYSSRETAYFGFEYFIPSVFRNRFVAEARSPQTVPSHVSYQVKGKWTFRELALGWKHYFYGAFDQDLTWNFYGLAAFGLGFHKAENTVEGPVDTSLYTMAPVPVIGSGSFKRLTFDLGIGLEYPLGANVYVYGEAKTWLPMSQYSSPFLHSNRKVPMPAIVVAGLRILFGD